MTDYPSRPTSCSIDLSALRNNFRFLRKSATASGKLLAVVKADAYGHGAAEVSKELEKMGVDFLGVAILEEAIELREAGIKAPILLLGGLFPGQEGAIFEYDLTPLVFSLDWARKINDEAILRKEKKKIHLKIDTGMGRIGVQTEEVRDFFSSIRELSSIEVEGAATHFASADAPEGAPGNDYTALQRKRFKEALAAVQSLGFNIPLIHAANSAALFNHPDTIFNMARPGILLYGASPLLAGARGDELKCVMSFKTRIMDVKSVKKGFRVSYDGTYTAPGDRKIAVIPVGYADGYRRELSGKGEVLVRGKRAHIAGRICMDMTMIDVSGIDGVEAGDEVLLFGENGTDRLPVDEVAALAGTISYEILCGITKRVPKRYINAL